MRLVRECAVLFYYTVVLGGGNYTQLLSGDILPAKMSSQHANIRGRRDKHC